ncbi:MAG TPA: hypothetical protein O0X23_03925 [Methanocorpusculum sp.]|nr:hypothetical protein [Methanocorpusculum sp.]
MQIPESLFMNLPAKVFWWISDYGSSTKRIIGVFFALNGIFTLIYSFIHLLPVTDLQEYTTWPLWLPMSFAQTILIPFSITEIELKSIRLCMTGLVVTHVVLGYVILAALVTRFAVMFQDQGP